MVYLSDQCLPKICLPRGRRVEARAQLRTNLIASFTSAGSGLSLERWKSIIIAGIRRKLLIKGVSVAMPPKVPDFEWCHLSAGSIAYFRAHFQSSLDPAGIATLNASQPLTDEELISIRGKKHAEDPLEDGPTTTREASTAPGSASDDVAADVTTTTRGASSRRGRQDNKRKINRRPHRAQ